MIAFRGIDVLTEDAPSPEEVQRAIAVALFRDPERVLVVDDLANHPESGPAEIVCVMSRAHGDFAGHLSIAADSIELPLESQLEIISRLAEELETRCLTATDDDNPYLMWLVSPAGTIEKVALDTNAYDEERYVVKGPA